MNYILQQGNYILSNGNNIFQTGDQLQPCVLELDPTLITGKVNGDPLSQWKDTSGYNNHAVQMTATYQPTYKTNQINGLPAIEFDGTDDRLELTFASQVKTVFMVLKTLNHANSNGMLFSQIDPFYWASNTGFWFRPSGDVPNTFGSGTLGATPTNRLYSNGGLAITAAQATKTYFYQLLCLDIGDTAAKYINLIGCNNSGFHPVSLAYLQAYDYRLNYAERQMRSAQLLTKFAL